MESLDLHAEARARFGVPSLHKWQEDAVRAVLGDTPARALVIAPTGGGKSLTYQLPAVLLPGTALVVSPLISLMDDQVRSLTARGIPATYLASTLEPDERRDRVQRVRRGEFRLVYLAPERLGDDLFSLVAETELSLLAVDEAHCIVQWGQDFRPDYARLGELVRRRPPARLLACTATATPETRTEILRALGLDNPRTTIVMRGFARPNLALTVSEASGPKDARTKTKAALLTALGSARNPTGTGIVYAATRRATETIAAYLEEGGFAAKAYHAGMDGDVRARVARAFAMGKANVVVATNAFGMGIDRPDVRVVVHAQPPSSIESYYQEVGRAGRDGEPATGLLLFADADIALRRRLIELSDDGSVDPVAVARSWALFRDLLRYVDACSCRHDFILRYFGDEAESLGGCGRCDVCKRAEAERDRDPESDARDTEIVRKTLAAVARAAKRGGMVVIAEMLRGQPSERVRRFGFDGLSTYGLLSSMSQDEVMRVLRASIAAGYVDLTTGDFPLPFLTAAGGRVMRAQEESRVRLPRTAPAAPAARERRARSKIATPGAEQAPREVAVPSSDEARLRFEALRVMRAELAKATSVPAYVVAHDAALLAAAEANPASGPELEALRGWGPVKVERYGEAVLRALHPPPGS